MDISRRTFTLAGLAATALAGCGGGSSSNTNLRLLNTNVSSPNALSLEVNGTVISSGVAFGSAGSYVSVGTDTNTVRVLDQNGTAIYSSSFSLSGSSGPYTLVVAGFSGSTHTTTLTENQSSAASSRAYLRILDQCPDAGDIDIYMLGDGETLASATPLVSLSSITLAGYYTLNSGTYTLVVTGAGSRDDVRLSQSGITLASTSVQTLVLSSAAGGVLVDATLVLQQSTATTYRNTQSRLRVVSALPSQAVASATVTSGGSAVSLLSSLVSPAIGTYSLVASGSLPLSLTINGTTSSQTVALTAGNDYTVLVYGDAASPQTALLSDSNRLPTASTTANVRLYHACGTSTAATALSIGYVPIVSGVTLGSSALGVLSNTPYSSTQLTVSGGVSYSAGDIAVASNGLYSMFIMGSTASPVGQLYRER